MKIDLNEHVGRVRTVHATQKHRPCYYSTRARFGRTTRQRFSVERSAARREEDARKARPNGRDDKHHVRKSAASSEFKTRTVLTPF